ncbi:acylphosphatase [Halochromatium roseum]|uniref:acylphosphatase n=1 Tax=Halochromatium roseum TaxID=391920 RepID=UPI001911CC97|nr:acylphosphatase [Halochromatium roseum]MBK5940111.1 acylphosphatase [Halochromatium roseum]
MTDSQQRSGWAGARCIRCFVSGRVQGVFFRASAAHEAQALGITGYARNLPDGRVEVLACGDAAALDTFKSWLHRGPAAAAVSAVACETQDYRPLSDFSTR